VSEAGSSRRVEIVLIAALAENGVIGRDNKLPWRIKSDMQYFRSLTMGKPVVMGRKTFQSIGKPLKGRTNIVVSRDPNFAGEAILVAPDIARALQAAQGDALRRGCHSIAIIGGTEIFRQTMPLADRLALTLVHAKPQGDTVFPSIDGKSWRATDPRQQPKGPEDEYGFSFVHYERVGAA
jgi:dihydrofolate reductase